MENMLPKYNGILLNCNEIHTWMELEKTEWILTHIFVFNLEYL